jgi:hypothetical protein
MRQCQGTTATGRRCRRQVEPGTRYCHQHAPLVDLKRVAAMAKGAFAGQRIVPGPVGLIGGAIFGAVTDHYSLTAGVKKKVFLSFDFDNDRGLKHFMVGQSRLDKSPFEIIDTSLKEAAPEAEWVGHAERAIGRSDLVMIMLGKQTYRARGVLTELGIATRLGVRTVQIRPTGTVARPVAGGGRVYTWNWDNLERILG